MKFPAFSTQNIVICPSANRAGRCVDRQRSAQARSRALTGPARTPRLQISERMAYRGTGDQDGQARREDRERQLPRLGDWAGDGETCKPHRGRQAQPLSDAHLSVKELREPRKSPAPDEGEAARPHQACHCDESPHANRRMPASGGRTTASPSTSTTGCRLPASTRRRMGERKSRPFA